MCLTLRSLLIITTGPFPVAINKIDVFGKKNDVSVTY